MANPSPTERVSARMAAESQAQTKRLVTKLQSEFNGPDRTNVSSQTWHAMIRQNWDDPMWRQAQSNRIGDVQFATDAMNAFGIDPRALKTMPLTPTPGVDMPEPSGPQPNPIAPTPPQPGVSQ